VDNNKSKRALDGLIVLDLSENISGPYCTKLLGALGAEVIKIEKPDTGDPSRQLGPFPDDVPHLEKSALFLYLNTNKKSVTLDLTQSKQLGQFKKLVEKADILVENFAPGVMSQLGLDYDTLSKINSELVMESITDFGQTGPYRHYKGGRLVNYALSGYTYVNGDPKREPLTGGGEQPAYQGGINGYVSALSAILMREKTGQGQYIDVSIHECMSTIHQFTVNRYIYSGKIQPRFGNRYMYSYPTTIYPCKDGLVSIAPSSDEQGENLLLMMGMEHLLEDPRFQTGFHRLENADAFDEAVNDWFLDRTRKEIVEASQEWRIPAAYVNNMKDVLEDDQYLARDFWKKIVHPEAGEQPYAATPFKMSETPAQPERAPLLGEHNQEILGETAEFIETGTRKRRSEPQKTKSRVALPLAGVRVLDLTRVWSGPLASRVLADLGAEVIHILGRITIPTVEYPQEVVEILGVFPDNVRGEKPWNRSSLNNELGRNKLSLTLELNTPEGLDLFKQLVQKSDVVIENFSPRVMPNFGLDYDALKSLNPRLIMCSMPGYGLTGPYRDYVSYGTNLDPASGLASLMGYAGDRAHMSGNAYPDPAAALHAASAILTALVYRQKTSRGQHIDLAQSESATCLVGEAVLGYALTGTIPYPNGNRHQLSAPQGIYRCQGDDKWVAVAVNTEEEWQGLLEVIDLDELKSGRFSTNESRMSHHDELDRLIETWTVQFSHQEVMQRLQQKGVPAGALWNAPELITDPQLNERGFYWEIGHPDVGPKIYCGFPVQMSDVSEWPKRPAPCLGEHNAQVLKTVLGFTDEEIKKLEQEGVIGTEPID
jgi:crotonobetainyl-CoA:carnitine CoA-transferase CaiB-like acyl-CoA transferase